MTISRKKSHLSEGPFFKFSAQKPKKDSNTTEHIGKKGAFVQK
jgi:hypothetical protein